MPGIGTKTWNSSISAPPHWPSAPKVFSVTTLLQIESCPRKWALENADYPHVWTKKGYPTRPSIALLKGIIIHRTIELVTQKHLELGCTSLQDPLTVKAMRDLGGFSSVITEAIQYTKRKYTNNPRAEIPLAALTQNMGAMVADVRTKVQALLSQSSYSSSGVAKRMINVEGVTSTSLQLTKGTYSEVPVSDQNNSWKGFIDRVEVSDNQLVLKDFKSGAEQPSDGFQLQVYAWLLYQDINLNPLKRLADRLTIIYPYGQKDVEPLNKNTVIEFDSSIRARTQAAIGEISKAPPSANISFDKCPRCGVRQLCDNYWESMNVAGAQQLPRTNFVDIELVIKNQRGPISWNAKVNKCSNNKVIDKEVVVLSRNSDLPNDQTNSVLRVTGAYLDKEDDEDMFIIMINKSTEVIWRAQNRLGPAQAFDK